MDSRHDISPDGLVVGGSSCNASVVVVAGPDARRIVGRKAYEPQVVVAGGRTAFSRGGHSGNGSSRAGGAGLGTGRGVEALAYHRICHGVCDQESGRILHDTSGFRFVFNQDLAVVIQNLCEEHRLSVLAAVGNGGESVCHLQIGDA